MSIINEITAAIKRNPKINRVIVSAREMEAMREEYVDLVPGAPPHGTTERRLWLWHARLNTFHIMGRPVQARQ